MYSFSLQCHRRGRAGLDFSILDDFVQLHVTAVLFFFIKDEKIDRFVKASNKNI